MNDPSVRKSVENRRSYEAILNRSLARYPDIALPDIVNFDSEADEDFLKGQFFSSVGRKIRSKEPIYFDQLHINAVHQRFVSADEMKFLILVAKFLSRGKSQQVKQHLANYYTELSFQTLTVLRFT